MVRVMWEKVLRIKKKRKENVINTYPLRTLLGQFGDKTLNTVLRRFEKGYNKLLKEKKENNPK